MTVTCLKPESGWQTYLSPTITLSATPIPACGATASSVKVQVLTEVFNLFQPQANPAFLCPGDTALVYNYTFVVNSPVNYSASGQGVSCSSTASTLGEGKNMACVHTPHIITSTNLHVLLTTSPHAFLPLLSAHAPCPSACAALPAPLTQSLPLVHSALCVRDQQQAGQQMALGSKHVLSKRLCVAKARGTAVYNSSLTDMLTCHAQPTPMCASSAMWRWRTPTRGAPTAHS